MAERPLWQEFDPSTFTHIGRNDSVVNWVCNYQRRHDLGSAKRVLLLGAGAVEPFTIAALPALGSARVFAVDINPDLIQIASDLKRGSAVAWADFAKYSLNPGRPNSDLLDQRRIQDGLSVLSGLGSLTNLGSGFNIEQMQVLPSVRDRVEFLHTDALEALTKRFNDEFDIVGDFFLQPNINKSKNHKFGLPYSYKMVNGSLRILSENGIYVLGVTGRDLANAVGHFQRTTDGMLNICSLTHAVNFGTGYASSHYLVATLLDPFPSTAEIREEVEANLEDGGFSGLPIRKLEGDLGHLGETARNDLQLAWVSEDGDKGHLWVATPQQDALKELVPDKDDEFSRSIVFPAQKPHLAREMTRRELAAWHA